MKIIIIDIETTGFLPSGLIIEIAIVKLDLESGKTEVIYNELIKEKEFNETHKDSWIFSNSDIKFNEVMKSKEIDKETIQNILSEYNATAYNKKFDFDFLKSRGFKLNELPCPMKISTNICKIQKKVGYKYPKLKEAWNTIMKTEYTQLHRASDDALKTAKIVYELYKNGIFSIEVESKKPETENRVEVLSWN